MRKIYTISIFAVLMCLLLVMTGCAGMAGPVVLSVGEYESREFYTSGGFQDYTDYAKYFYKETSPEDSEYLQKISEEDRQKILMYIENFEQWVETVSDEDGASSDKDDTLSGNYDFNKSIIDTDDYFYLKVDEDDGFDDYDLYIFDTGTEILYYFHNNI